MEYFNHLCDLCLCVSAPCQKFVHTKPPIIPKRSEAIARVVTVWLIDIECTNCNKNLSFRDQSFISTVFKLQQLTNVGGKIFRKAQRAAVEN